MTGKTMDERVEDLEKLAQTLAPLPAEVRQVSQRMASVESRLGGVEARVGTVVSQIVQLRTEVSDGFSAIRSELQEDIAGLSRDTAQGLLRVEVKMRTLFEEYVGRRAVIAEGHPAVDEPQGGA
jgi:predicted nuclease with TOPRIM domain